VNKGDEAAFREMYLSYWEPLVRNVRLLVTDPEIARDVVQESFVRAFVRWNHVSRLDNPYAWLRRVAMNLGISWLRRRSLSRLMTNRLRDERPAEPQTGPYVSLACLSPRQRAVVILRYYEDLPIAEVSEVLGIRPGTVRALTSQALTNLRKTVKSQEDIHG
jgi:RNA polymerase sigma-70 factor (sigma-E family)